MEEARTPTQTAEPWYKTVLRVLSSWPVRLLGTGLCLYLLFRNIDVPQAMKVIGHADIRLVCVVAIGTLIVQLCSMAEWAVLIRSAAPVPWSELNYSFWKSLAPTHLIPTGFGGDASRIYDMCGSTGTAAATAATFVGRLGSTSALMFWALVASIEMRNSLAIAASAVGLVVVFGMWLTALAPNAVAIRLIQWTKRLSYRAPRAVLGLAQELNDLRANRHSLALSLCISLVGWGIQNLTLSLLAHAVGLSVPWFLFAMAVPFSLIATMAPFALNGYGLREGILVAILLKAGLSATNAAAVALLVDLQMVPFIFISALMWLPRCYNRTPRTTLEHTHDNDERGISRPGQTAAARRAEKA
jgi:uncharacterized protein (TIRG00374 family)